MIHRRSVRDRPRFLWLTVIGVLAFLYIPISIAILFSFNSGRNLYDFQGFSLRWYTTLFGNSDLMASLWLSLGVAVVVAVLSVIFGIGLAFGIRRGVRWFGGSLQGAVILRVVTPETATGVALLLLLSQLGVPLSELTLILSHTALCVAFAAVVILSRMAVLNEQLEEAARDLGATRLSSLWFVVLPALRPALIGAALLSFVLSFTNFITSFFSSGIGATPLPVRIYSMLRVGVTPVVNAAGVMMLAVTLAAILITVVIARWITRRNRASAATLIPTTPRTSRTSVAAPTEAAAPATPIAPTPHQGVPTS